MAHTSEIIGIDHIFLAVSDLPMMDAYGSGSDRIHHEITNNRAEQRQRHGRWDET